MRVSKQNMKIPNSQSYHTYSVLLNAKTKLFQIDISKEVQEAIDKNLFPRISKEKFDDAVCEYEKIMKEYFKLKTVSNKVIVYEFAYQKNNKDNKSESSFFWDDYSEGKGIVFNYKVVYRAESGKSVRYYQDEELHWADKIDGRGCERYLFMEWTKEREMWFKELYDNLDLLIDKVKKYFGDESKQLIINIESSIKLLENK